MRESINGTISLTCSILNMIMIIFLTAPVLELEIVSLIFGIIGLRDYGIEKKASVISIIICTFVLLFLYAKATATATTIGDINLKSISLIASTFMK